MIPAAAAAPVSLRYYQQDAIDGIAEAVARKQNAVVSLPTGSGKTVIIAALTCRAANKNPTRRFVVVAPTRELVEQDEAALLRLFQPEEVGVVCAALDRRETDRRIVVGTPQSLAGAIEFDPGLVIIDEAHLMPLHSGSWFARLFDNLPRGRRTQRVGLSATTFRTADGAIFGPDGWFDVEAYAVSPRELIVRGHLSPIRYVSPASLMTVTGITVTAGDYNQGQLVNANIDLVDAQADIILEAMRDRHKAMVFAVTVVHAEAFVEAFERRGEEAALIVGALSRSERSDAVDKFRSGDLRMAVTVVAALTGFDVPEIDLIASCRPTQSPIVHVQGVGRGTRVAADKDDCLVLDFVGNVDRFGPVHSPNFEQNGQLKAGKAPWSACDECGTYNRAEAQVCSHCSGVLRGSRRHNRIPVEIEHQLCARGAGR